jgi:hypothetical protein
MKGKVLIEDGAIDAQTVEAVGHQSDRDPLGSATPSTIDGACEVPDVASILGTVDHPVEQGIGRLELSESSNNAGIRGANAPFVVGHRNLTTVMFGCSHGNKENTRSTNLLCSQPKIVDVLGAAVDFEWRSGPDLQAHGILQNRGAETIEEGLLQIGQTHRIVKLLRARTVRAIKTEWRFPILDLAVFPQDRVFPGSHPILVPRHVEGLFDFVIRHLDNPVSIGIV